MQPVDMHDCIARVSVLNEAVNHLSQYRSANRRQEIAVEWLMRKLGDESQVWHDKSASVAVHQPIEIYNDH